MQNSPDNSCFIPFQQSVKDIALPQKFTFPFYYEPHLLAKIAAEELKAYLKNQTEWSHNFGLDNSHSGLVIGKMFGVLVVQKYNGELGYLAGFSGKLANSNHWSYFVPPVFDILEENGFFKKEEITLNTLNATIQKMEESQEYKTLQQALHTIQEQANTDLQEIQKRQKLEKEIRHAKRKHLASEEELEKLRQESVRASYFLKDRMQYWKKEIGLAKQHLSDFETKIKQLQEKRKYRSNLLQKKIFEQYTFLNQSKIPKSLYAIFQEHNAVLPPAGAGECVAPKLLQYCFANDLKPICMAEFWWGASPISEIRKHEQFYPACKGKCEPILKHMLEAVEMDDNPMLQAIQVSEIPILYEDAYIVVINKPSELLSVPGKAALPSVYSYFKAKNPQWEDPIIVHRLDQSTSGIMVLAKDLKTYRQLQKQFVKRSVKKRYLAVLSKEIESIEGEIKLPLRVNLEDRPRQMVCYEHGKQALTHYQVLQKENGKTYIHFYPHTGRTHQLRVHAAHTLGLNAPIIGDDLYGEKAQRLLLHANLLTFRHPVTNVELTIECAAEFVEK